MIKEDIVIIGLGGIGSPVAEKLIEMGMSGRFILYDHDVVEPHNLRNQKYRYRHIGTAKADALAEMLADVVSGYKQYGVDIEIVALREKITEKSKLSGVVIAAVDSAQSRKDIFSACRFNPNVPLYIEAGAGGNIGVVRALVPHDKDHVKTYDGLLAAMLLSTATPCVTPVMGGQFASLVAFWLDRFSGGEFPKTVMESHILYDPLPRVVTEPIMG